MGAGFDILDDVAKNPRGIDDERPPLGKAKYAADVVRLDDALVTIGDQFKWERVLLLELPLRLQIIGADADDNRIERAESFESIPKRTRLGCTSWRECIREEVEHHPFPTQTLQAQLAAGRRSGKIRGW